MDTRPSDSNRFWNELMIQHCRTWRKPWNGMTAYCVRELLEEPIDRDFADFMRKGELEAIFGKEGVIV